MLFNPRPLVFAAGFHWRGRYSREGRASREGRIFREARRLWAALEEDGIDYRVSEGE